MNRSNVSKRSAEISDALSSQRMNQPLITTSSLSKRYGDVVALDRVDLRLVRFKHGVGKSIARRSNKLCEFVSLAGVSFDSVSFDCVEVDGNSVRFEVDGTDLAHIAVEDLALVVVADLHDAIADSEGARTVWE